MNTNLKTLIAFFKTDIHKINGFLTLKERITKKQLKVWVDDLFDDLEKLQDFEAELRKEKESIESYKGTNVHIWYEERYLVLKKLKEILGESP